MNCPARFTMDKSRLASSTPDGINMSRMARVVMPGVPLHITQRGIRRFDVVRDEADRHSYIKLLGESCRRFHLRICAYCLMSNHVHLVAIPERPDSMWRTLHRCHGLYATGFNMKYGFSGHLWQARPFSCALDEEHFWTAIRYVECNPVRARMVTHAEDYPWSSAAAHCGVGENPLLDRVWISPDQIQNWKQWLAAGNESGVEQRIRDRTFTGRPCGDENFVRQTEQALGRRLVPQKPGPKSKASSATAEPAIWTSD